MSNVLSDLEEGEIVDDPPSPVCLPKPKKLPRRYTLKDSQNKHKKSCKHHTSKLEVSHKKSPHSSSLRVRSVKLSCKQSRSSKPVRHHSPFPKKNSTPSLDTIKLKSILDLTKLKSSNPDLKSDVASCDFSEISAMYEKVRAENIKNNLGKTSSEIDYSQREVGIKPVENKHITNFEKEESEDEEELRRIALSTCMAKTPISEPEISKHFVEDIDLRLPGDTSRVPKHVDPLEADKFKEVCEATSSTVNPNPSIANNYKVAGLCLDDGLINIHPPIADNYEVIDMELDDDDNGGGGGKSDDLFVIDTKPSVDLQTNSNSTAEKQSVVSDDDFELDILRAELIENMYRSSTNETKNHNLNTKASLKNQKKFVSQKTKRPPTAITKGKVTKFQKRLIITLNAESSDESEDDEDAEKKFPENPVASIEALISDIRQKSDEAKEIPTAVSCLSKAQQEEYNALMKILEKKKQDVPEENKVAHSPVNDLKVLEEKLIEVSELLKGKKSKLQELLKDVARHKQVYMKSKLTAQLLKEQFVAAEKVRRLKLQSWSNCCKKYEVAKKTVSELEFKTDNLKNLCSRVGSSINGRSYSLPTTCSFS